MSGITQARHDLLREEILDAMERRIASAGLSGLSMRGIAEAAGCSPAMIYKVGVGHDELVLMVNARTLDAIGDALCAAVAAGPRGEEMRTVACAYLDYAQAHTPRWDALFAHRMSEGREVPEWYAARRDLLFVDVAAILGLGRAGLDRARMLFAAVHGVVALGMQQKIGAMTPQALRAQVCALVDVLAAGMDRATGDGA